jgi:fucose permease
MAALGLVGPSWGPALVPARGEFHLGLLAAGALVGLFGASRTAGSAAAAVASDRLPRPALLALYGAALVAALGAVALAPSWTVVLAGAGGIGWTFGALATEVNAVASLGAPARRARDLNLVNAAYGLGASLGPLVVGLVLGAGLGWRSAFGLWTAVAVPPLAGLAWAARDLPRPVRAAGPAPRPAGALWALPLMALLYNGIGWTVSTWAPTWLLARFHTRLLTGAAASTVFYACLTGGRAGDAALLGRLPLSRLLWLQSLAAAVALVGLALAPDPVLALAAFGAAGLTLGGVYPNLVAQGVALAPDRPGAVSGWIATGGAIGVGLVPLAAGALGRLAGPGAMVWALPALGAAMVALAWRLVRQAGGHSA